MQYTNVDIFYKQAIWSKSNKNPVQPGKYVFAFSPQDEQIFVQINIYFSIFSYKSLI